MAEAEDDGDSDTTEVEELSLEDKIDRASSQAAFQMWKAILMFPLSIVIFIVTVVGLKYNLTATQTLVLDVPENRAAAYGEKIKQTRSKVKKQYAEHSDKMDDESLLSLNQKFKTLYRLSIESEADYGLLLDQHKSALFKIASTTKGSGEWYGYHESKLGVLGNKQSRRESNMQSYFKLEDSLGE